jgi:hypothetical protein
MSTEDLLPFLTKDAFGAMLRAMKEHPDQVKIQEHGCKLFRHFIKYSGDA